MPLAQKESQAIILVYHSMRCVKAMTKVAIEKDLFINTSRTTALSHRKSGSTGTSRNNFRACRLSAHGRLLCTTHDCLCSSVGRYKCFGPRSLKTSEYPWS